MPAINYEKLIQDLAESHIQGIKRIYPIAFKDGVEVGIEIGRDLERKEHDRAVSEGTRMGSSECAKQLRNRRND
ncbi:hypothetical protein HLH17_09355 [Acinetobacter sp. ANC 5380]|uniref:Uncharacterized protein n=1 Tax=Acinetobacter terrae TaxID=2731247 RepID=A0A7Y2RFQ6_9GAMM|nr:hypothetical protein [Acinetobacter terrae]NNH77862.1 hypothetical protein [Acinetobacter terrae]